MSADKKLMSFTAANVLPFKLLRDRELMTSLYNSRKIIPIHIQFMPTNRCNLKCAFCSCSKRDKKLEMPFDECREIIELFRGLGTKAVTITGGGEPVLHKSFEEIIYEFSKANIKIGLVSNGKLLGGVSRAALSKIKWCRVSCSDERKLEGSFRRGLEAAIENGALIDWAFSYVLSSKPDYGNLKSHIEFANDHKFTHVRVVADLLNPNDTDIGMAKKTMEDMGIDQRFVIWQGRKTFVRGREKCLISLLKPVIHADGNLYPCCGTQYMRSKMDLDMVPEISMGKASNAERIWTDQKHFDGSDCSRCYYDNYNVMLGALSADISHGEFV